MDRAERLPVAAAHSGHTYRRLLAYALPHWPLFAVAIAGFFLFSTMEVALIAIAELLLDAVGADIKENHGFLSRFVAGYFPGGVMPQQTARWLVPVAMLTIVFLRAVGNFSGSYGLAYVARAVIHRLRSGLFAHIGQLPGSYFDQHTGAHLISKVSYNVEQITTSITSALKTLIRSSFTAIGLLVYLLLVNWKLTLTFFLFAPVIALVVNLVGRRFRLLSHRIQNTMGDVTQVTQEAINGYRVVRLYGGHDYENTRFTAASNNNRQQFMKLVVANNGSVSLIQILVGLATALLVWLALDPEMLGVMTPSVFATYIGAAASLAKPIRNLSEIYAQIQKGVAAAESIFAIFDAPKEPPGGSARLPQPVQGRLEFQGVSFRYRDDGPEVLKQIDLVVPAGQTVALVGASGSGKSTLASLLSGFYAPTQGRILLDGVDITQLALAELRRQIAMVSQHIVLFNDSVRRNIAYGELAARSPQQLQRALEGARARAFVEALPQGLETLLGDDGQMLSGGQRQRLAIARALLKDAPLLILDEATSALDNESERHIQAALAAVMENRTTLVIAHRLSTIEHADCILVLEAGRVVERGSHSELLARGGHYARLRQQQAAAD